MGTLSLVLQLVYGVLLLFILLYSIAQTFVMISYVRKRKAIQSNEKGPAASRDLDLPMVTVQLPVYNEAYVVERLIDAVAAFDYPREKLEIQVLDDSTDESAQITQAKVDQYSALGVDIKRITRSVRTGFKAGALQHGMESCKGEYIAIFDADFIPRQDFLLKTVPYFEDPQIGVVQTRWEHLNRDYSLLTELQAIGLDAHFSVEQMGRNASGHFINFNGTAGIWRKTTIVDAGGWQADTLTEDLDLSYRAQVRGWKFKYLENFVSPAELPAAMNAVKTQQFRWTKGAAECARKNLGPVLRSKDVSTSTKGHALFHLLNSFLFVCIIASALISVPLLLAKNLDDQYSWLFRYGSVFFYSLLSLGIFYFISFSNRYGKRRQAIIPFIVRFPLFLSVYMGLSLHNGIAVIEGYLGRKSPFIRTPKFNVVNKRDKWQGNKYLTSSINWLTLVEMALVLYFAAGIYVGIRFQDYGLLPFHILLALGFGAVSWYSIRHSLNLNSKP